MRECYTRAAAVLLGTVVLVGINKEVDGLPVKELSHIWYKSFASFVSRRRDSNFIHFVYGKQ